MLDRMSIPPRAAGLLACFALILGSSDLLVAKPATALTIASQAVEYRPLQRVFHFTLTFSGVPDFFTVDEAGRPKDEFQFYLTWQLHPTNPSFAMREPDVLVRGGEIRTAGGIPIRDSAGEGGEGSGGWGPIRGIVAYELSGQTVTFDVPRGIIGDDDGRVAYGLLVCEYGGETDETWGSTDTPVPVASQSWGRLKALYRGSMP